MKKPCNRCGYRVFVGISTGAPDAIRTHDLPLIQRRIAPFLHMNIACYPFTKTEQILFLRRALPDNHHPPAQLLQRGHVIFIALQGTVQFFLPILRVGGRPDFRVPTGWASMPKTAVDKNDRFILRQDDIWISRQVPPLKLETVAHAVEQLADTDFRRGVGAVDFGHDLATLFRVKHIRHRFSLRLKLNPQTWVSLYLRDNRIVLFNNIGQLCVPRRAVEQTVLADICGQKLLNIPHLNPSA